MPRVPEGRPGAPASPGAWSARPIAPAADPAGLPLEGWARSSHLEFDPQGQRILRVRTGDPDLLAREAFLLSRLDEPAGGSGWRPREEPAGGPGWRPREEAVGWPRLVAHEEEGRLVTSFREGRCLLRVLERLGPPDPAGAVDILRRCAGTVAAIQALGQPAGQPGPSAWIWTAVGPFLPDPGQPDPPAIAAPECLAGRPTGFEADLYALGLLGCELLTGAPPPLPPMPDRLQAPPPTLPETTGLPGSLRACLAACLEPDPERRPSLRTLLSELHAADQKDPEPVLRVDDGSLIRLADGQAIALGAEVEPIPAPALTWPATEPRSVRLVRLGSMLEVWVPTRAWQPVRINGSLMGSLPGRLVPGDRMALGSREMAWELAPWTP